MCVPRFEWYQSFPMIYGTKSPDYVLRLLPEAQVMQFVKCSEDEAILLVRHGYISFLAASRCKCTSCRMPTCDGTCLSAQKAHKLMSKICCAVHGGPPTGTVVFSPRRVGLVRNPFGERMWAEKAKHILTQYM
jgi:hypothetical protein